MASLGVAIALRGLVQIIWSGETQQYAKRVPASLSPAAGRANTPDSIFIAIVAVVLVVGVYLVLTRTKMGKAMRATADNPDLALVSGIDTPARYPLELGDRRRTRRDRRNPAGRVSGATPAHHGMEFLIPLFAAVILGGIGNPYGALVGAFLIE